MKFWDLIKIANRNLFRNKLRTFLTVAAIFVGSFTLTMTNGLGDGMRSYVESQVKNFESDRVLMVRKKVEEPSGPKNGAEEYKDAPDGDSGLDPNSFLITEQQITSLTNGIVGIMTVTPRYNIGGEYITLDGTKKYKVELGMLSEGITQKTEAGKPISGERQIVFPVGLARTFDPNIDNLIGRTATLGYRNGKDEIVAIALTVVGVATKGFMTNTSSFVDASTAKLIHNDQRRGDTPGKYIGFSMQMDSPERIDAAKKVLDERGFTAVTMADNQKRTYDALGIFKIAMSLVAAIALLAASFGIINTLVIAVLERTKEIGLQKALGMSRGKIFAIFSLESVLIGFWGALLGTVFGIAVGLITNKVLIAAYAESFEGFNLFAFTLPSIASVMLIVSAVAFFAGVMPAFRASRLNPIDSLRYE
ncbi:MAG: ABC transporter permease [Acidobacteria bacterium]|nr:ABC transporter permease [Acidobacteriota bacterium]MBP7474375.1 ABC transporter permease [Pyrinomonadaceae bacterium]